MDSITQLMQLLFRFRRLASPSESCANEPCEVCFATHRPKIEQFMAKSEPVHFVILAFPAKSPNAQKVLGTLPDLAERLSVQFLQSFCDYVTHFYAPGARITICSDGHVFGDLVGVSDDDVSQYRDELALMIDQAEAHSVDLYSLDDAAGKRDFNALRAELVRDYATPVDELRKRMATDESFRFLFNGIHRFMFEDQLALRPDRSRNKLRTECKDLAYRVIQRSDAWGSLVAEAFPAALRLSIHPQPAHSEKIGFHMIRTRDNWLTPWHGVALDDGNTITLVKRSEAERRNASLVWRNKRPSHFIAPDIAELDVA
jgi:pyoverdine/dityrosine biosynthesis protein Dit1